MSEDEIQIEFVKYLETEGIKFSMIPNELGVFKRIPGFYQILNRFIHLGLRKGLPDMLLTVNNTLVFIEFKTATGELSEHQKRWIESIRACGVVVFVCRSVEEAIEAINSIDKK